MPHMLKKLEESNQILSSRFYISIRSNQRHHANYDKTTLRDVKFVINIK